MASVASAVRDAVSHASEATGLLQSAGQNSSELNELGSVPGHGLGTAMEERLPRPGTSVKAVVTGARRRGNRHGRIGDADLALASALMHCVGLLFFFGGLFMLLQSGGVPLSFSFCAGVGLFLLSFLCWFSRSILRLMHGHRRPKHARGRAGVAAPVDELDIQEQDIARSPGDMGSFLFIMRTASHALEVAATACLASGSLAWFFQDKVSGILGYALWYLGAMFWVVQHFLESRVVTQVMATSYLLPGHSQRMRAVADWSSNTGYLIASPFLLSGAISFLCGWYQAATLQWLSCAIILIGPAVTDPWSAALSVRLQYSEQLSIAASQAALDMHQPPSHDALQQVLPWLAAQGLVPVEDIGKQYDIGGGKPKGVIESLKGVGEEVRKKL